MARKLTEVELFYVQHNIDKGVEALAKIFKGVGVTNIQLAIDDVVTAEVEQLKAGEKGESALKGKTDEEIRQIVKDENIHRTGNLFARRDGVTIMTEAAGELADARKILRAKSNPNFTKENSDKIHVINKK